MGVQEGAEFQLALVEDQADGTAAADRMRFVADAGDRCPPAVASTSRPATLTARVFVLTARCRHEVNAYLHRFSVANVRAEAPAFDEIGEPLTLVGPDGVLSSIATTNSIVCPSTLQVSRDGRWLLLLDVPAERVASTADFPVVWLLTWREARLRCWGSNDVLGAGIYTDQRQMRTGLLPGGRHHQHAGVCHFPSLARGPSGQDGGGGAAGPRSHGGSAIASRYGDSLVGTDLSLPSLEAELGQCRR